MSEIIVAFGVVVLAIAGAMLLVACAIGVREWWRVVGGY